MTEFALILPVFMLIVIGLLIFGRVFFYWIETNHLASETARWASVDRNPAETDTPPRTLHDYARSGGQTLEFERDTRVCIDYPEGAPLELGDPVRVRVQKPFTVIGGWTITIRGSSTIRIERLANSTSAAKYTPTSPFGACT